VLDQQIIDRFAQQYGLGNACLLRELVELLGTIVLEVERLLVLGSATHVATMSRELYGVCCYQLRV
jgi:hypothetical protein